MSLVPADVSIDGLKNPRINTAIHWRSWILSPDTHSTVHPFRLGKKTQNDDDDDDDDDDDRNH